MHERAILATEPKVIAETERFVAVHKPPGVPCQGSVSGFLNLEGLVGGGLHLAHRLD